MLQKSAETDVSELLKLLPTMLRAKLRNLVHLIYMSLFFTLIHPSLKIGLAAQLYGRLELPSVSSLSNGIWSYLR